MDPSLGQQQDQSVDNNESRRSSSRKRSYDDDKTGVTCETLFEEHDDERSKKRSKVTVSVSESAIATGFPYQQQIRECIGNVFKGLFWRPKNPKSLSVTDGDSDASIRSTKPSKIAPRPVVADAADSERPKSLSPVTGGGSDSSTISRKPTTRKTAPQPVVADVVGSDSSKTATERRHVPKRIVGTPKEKKAIEKICMETGEILACFATAREAGESIGLGRPYIYNAARGYAKGRNCAGFGWRYEDLSEYYSRGTTTIRDLSPHNIVWVKSPGTGYNKKAVEQICKKTGKVLACFESAAKAGQVVGLSSCQIRHILNGSRGPHTCHFGWRYAETKPTSTGKKSTRKNLKKPIEKIVSETGEVLACFDSATSTGKKSTEKNLKKPIEKICSETGEVLACFDSATSTGKKSTGKNLKKPIEKICSETGEVLACFDSSTEAGKSVGATRSMISVAVCRSKSCKGFYWRLADLKKAGSKPDIRYLGAVLKDQKMKTLKSSAGLGWRYARSSEPQSASTASAHVAIIPGTTSVDAQEPAVAAPFDQDSLASESSHCVDPGLIVEPVGVVGSCDVPQVTYECSPYHIEVGDLVRCKYEKDDKHEAQWYRGRISSIHENETCDVVYNRGDVSLFALT
jgi:hypothetical protein